MSGPDREGLTRRGEVPEERIRKITSELTFQGGRIVHAAGRFKDVG